MALEGSLKEFGLADILQLIYYQRKTGELTVDAGFDRVRLLFYEGNIVFAESSKRGESRLGMILVKKGLITREQVDAALEEQKTTGGRLGTILINKEALSKDDLKETLTNQFTELVSYLFTWRQGRYEFKPQGIAIDKDIPISLDTQHILMEGLRILDEWSVVEGKITLESIFEKTSEEAPELNEEEKTIYALVDGENDVSAISGISGLDNFQVSKALLELYEKGHIKKQKIPDEQTVQIKKREKAKVPPLLLEALLAGLFVFSILFFFAGIAPDSAKVYRASEELDDLRFKLQVFRIENGRYPERLESVGDPIDPWGNAYKYSSDNSGFSLKSFGPDGVAGTKDDIY